MKRAVDKLILRRSFTRAAEACVRIGNFGAATKRPTTDEGLFFEDLSDSLAHDDLIELAVSARRLAEVGNFSKLARKRKLTLLMPVQFSPTKWKMQTTSGRLELYQLFDQLLHSTRFEVVSSDFKIKSLVGNLKGNIADQYYEAKYKTDFKPVVLIRTTDTPIVMLDVEEISSKCMSFLDHVSDQLSEQEIWLGNNNSE